MSNHDFEQLLHKTSHHANTCYEAVNRFCHPLFKNTPINYFDYGRYYDTGEAMVISSSVDFFVNGFEKMLFPSLEEYNLMYASGLKTVFLSHAMPLPLPPGVDSYTFDKYSEILDLAGTLNVLHRIYFIERCSDHYRVAGFGSDKCDISIINYFINSMPSLINFIHHFERSGEDLIEFLIGSHRIIIPNYLESRLQIEGLILPAQLPFNFAHKEPSASVDQIQLVTAREKDCLNLIAQGYTMKSIAQKLNISHRTVETHLRNIKDKYGLNTKNQLIDMWNEFQKPIRQSLAK